MRKLLNIKIFLFLAIIFYPQKNYSQKYKAEVIEELNHYINFSNESIHGLYILHCALSHFNRDLVNFSEQNTSRVDFRNRDFFNLKHTYYILPEESYKKCKVENSTIPQNQRKELIRILDKMNNILSELQILSDSVKIYTSNSEYKSDQNQKHGYYLLKKFEIHFKNFDTLKEELFQKIILINKVCENKNTGSSIINTNLEIDSLFQVCKIIIESVRESKIETTKKYSPILRNTINNLKNNKKSILGNDINNRFISKKFDMLIFDAEAIYSHTQAFLNTNEWENYYYEIGKDYYYYNEKFVNKYNRYGQGLVYNFNRFLEFSDMKILKRIEETHWFKVKCPKDKKAEVIVNKDITKHQIENLKGFAPNNMILLLDVSGSMRSKEKLPLLKKTIKYLIELMRNEDYVSVITYSGKATVELKSASNKKDITNIIDNLKSAGGTQILKGLKLSYKMATKNFIDNGNNRILLATDGIFPINKKLSKIIFKLSKKNISFSIIYLGRKEDRTIAEKFKEITNIGKGNYIYMTKKNAKKELLREAQAIEK